MVVILLIHVIVTRGRDSVSRLNHENVSLQLSYSFATFTVFNFVAFSFIPSSFPSSFPLPPHSPVFLFPLPSSLPLPLHPLPLFWVLKELETSSTPWSTDSSALSSASCSPHSTAGAEESIQAQDWED